jgi:hypothetical protein
MALPTIVIGRDACPTPQRLAPRKSTLPGAGHVEPGADQDVPPCCAVRGPRAGHWYCRRCAKRQGVGRAGPLPFQRTGTADQPWQPGTASLSLRLRALPLTCGPGTQRVVETADFPAVRLGLAAGGQVVEASRQFGVGVVLVRVEDAASQVGERPGACGAIDLTAVTDVPGD